MRVRQPLKWHGGKYYLAPKIVAMMPPHTHYVEPYAGGLAVLLAKNPEGVSEVVNDLDGELINFWRVLQRPESFELLKRRLEATPFSREEFEDAGEPALDPIDRAANLFIRVRQSFSALRRSWSPHQYRARRSMGGNVSAWINSIDGLQAVHSRLIRVTIENRNAIDVIRQHGNEGTLFYCDPPYMHETRTARTAYNHEMTTEQHLELLNTLLNIKGKFILSGYPSAMYDGFGRNAGWNRREIETSNHSSHQKQGETKRRMTEVLWFNYSLEEPCTTQLKTAA